MIRSVMLSVVVSWIPPGPILYFSLETWPRVLTSQHLLQTVPSAIGVLVGFQTLKAKRVLAKLANSIKDIDGVEVLLQHVKEYRAAAIFRGAKLNGHLSDSDPQKTGLTPHEVIPSQDDPSQEALFAASLANRFIRRAQEVLADEPKANFLMMRGFDVYDPLPDFCQLYNWRACAVASYPMYKGVSRLAGMQVIEEGQTTVEQQLDLLERVLPDFDFVFFHVKKTDSMGEDGNFEGKVKVIEHFDALVPKIKALECEVLCFTGDHSTPCSLASHSFHPVPLCIAAPAARTDACNSFDEKAFLTGGLGRIRATELMPLLLAHAGRLRKFGA